MVGLKQSAVMQHSPCATTDKPNPPLSDDNECKPHIAILIVYLNAETKKSKIPVTSSSRVSFSKNPESGSVVVASSNVVLLLLDILYFDKKLEQ